MRHEGRRHGSPLVRRHPLAGPQEQVADRIAACCRDAVVAVVPAAVVAAAFLVAEEFGECRGAFGRTCATGPFRLTGCRPPPRLALAAFARLASRFTSAGLITRITLRIVIIPLGIVVTVLPVPLLVTAKPRLLHLPQELHEHAIVVFYALVGLELEVGEVGKRGIPVGQRVGLHELVDHEVGCHAEDLGIAVGPAEHMAKGHVENLVLEHARPLRGGQTIDKKLRVYP